MNAMTPIHEISLVKGEERFVFRFTHGDELHLIDKFSSLAADPSVGFDWFDAAALSYQISRRLEIEEQDTGKAWWERRLTAESAPAWTFSDSLASRMEES